MSQTPQHDIRRLVEQLARRIRFQRAVDGLVTGGTIAAMLAMLALVLFKTDWIAESTLYVVTAVGCGAPIGLALLGWFSSLDGVALAQRLDRVHGLHDRLSTALAISDRGPQTEFEQAQIDDAAHFVSQVDVKPAAPFRRPTDLVPLVSLFVCLGALVMLRPPSHEQPIPQPPPIQHAQVLDPATIAMERNRLEQIRKELEGLQDPEAVELLEEIEELLEQVEERSISEKDFLEELERLERDYFDTEGEKERERIAQKLKEAAEALEKEAAEDLEKEPEAQELVDALKKKDLGAASKALEKLAEKLANKDLNEKQLERLARLMEKFADKIDPNNPALQKMMEKHKDLIDKLSKKFDAGKLNKQEKQRLDRAKKELEKLKEQQKKEEQRESTRELKKLRRLSRESSERAKKRLKGGEGDKEATEDKEHDFFDKAGRKQDQQEGENSKSGNSGEKASERMKRQGQQQKKDAARKMARKQLRDLREAMKRSGRKGSKSRQGQGDQGERKGKQMKEFLRRAKGQDGSSEGNQGRKPETRGEGDPDGRKGFRGAKEGSAEKGDDFNGEIKGETNLAGKGKGSRELGEETNLDSKRTDEQVDLEGGEGPSKSEIIRAASEDGFAKTEYKDVYVDYEGVVEEVMEKEKVPAGYRYYIKRYFQLIQPQE